jgi:hypothetical protein
MTAPLNPSDDPEGLGLSPEELAGFALDHEPSDDEEAPAADPTPTASSVGSDPAASPDSAAVSPATGTPAQASTPATSPPAGSVSPPVDHPLTFRVDGKDFAPKGAVVRPDGAVVIPKESWHALHRENLADRGPWRERETRYRQTIAELSQTASSQRTAAEQKADALVSAFQRISALPDEAFLTEALRLRTQMPVLTAQAEASYWQEQAKHASGRLAPIDQAQERSTAEPVLRDQLAEGLRQVTSLPEYAALKGSEDTLLERLWAVGQRQGAIGPDQTGQWIYDQRVYWALLDAEVEKVQAVSAARTRHDQVAAIEQRNKAALKPATAPPMVPVNTPAPAAATDAAKPKSRDDWQERMYALANSKD